MKSISTIYDLISSSPNEAQLLALDMLEDMDDQADKDDINWAMAYALVELKRFDEAVIIWQQIFDRTKNHRALHQVAFVHRSSGHLDEAIKLFQIEKQMLGEDIHSRAVNLYELAHCHFLNNDTDLAIKYFQDYAKIEFEEFDPIERACFYRLKGDIFSKLDLDIAVSAYEESIRFFHDAGDDIGVSEVCQKLIDIRNMTL